MKAFKLIPPDNIFSSWKGLLHKSGLYYFVTGGEPIEFCPVPQNTSEYVWEKLGEQQGAFTLRSASGQVTGPNGHAFKRDLIAAIF